MQKYSIIVLQVKWKNQLCIFPHNWKMNCLWKREDRFHCHLLLIWEDCNIDKAGDHFHPFSINQCWDSWPGRGWNMPSASLIMKIKSLENAEKWLKLFCTFSMGFAAIPQSPAMKTISGLRFVFLCWMFTSTMSSIRSFSQSKTKGSIIKKRRGKGTQDYWWESPLDLTIWLYQDLKSADEITGWCRWEQTSFLRIFLWLYLLSKCLARTILSTTL